MYKTRKNHMCARIPKDFEEFEELIESQGDKFHVYGTPFFSAIVGEGDDQSMVFIIQGLLTLLTAAAELHMDCTFKCLPEKPQSAQLLIIMAMHQSHVRTIFCILKIYFNCFVTFEIVFKKPFYCTGHFKLYLN